MGTPRPTDRLPPGLGKVRWREVFQLLREKKYPGYLSYEAPNPEYWSRPPEDVARSRRGDAETARGNRMTAWQLNRRARREKQEQYSNRQDAKKIKN